MSDTREATRDTVRDTARRAASKMQQLDVQQTTASLGYSLVHIGLYITSVLAFYSAIICGTGYFNRSMLKKMVTQSGPNLASASTSFFLLAGAVRLAAAINFENIVQQYLAMLTYFLPFVTTFFETIVYRTANLRTPSVQLTLAISGTMLGLMTIYRVRQRVQI